MKTLLNLEYHIYLEDLLYQILTGSCRGEIGTRLTVIIGTLTLPACLLEQKGRLLMDVFIGKIYRIIQDIQRPTYWQSMKLQGYRY